MPKDRKQTYSDRQAQAARDQKQQSAKTTATKQPAQSETPAKKRPHKVTGSTPGGIKP